MPDIVFDIGEAAKNPIVLWIIIIALVLGILANLAKNWPQLLKLKAFILIPLVRYFNFRFLEKEAVKSDIQGTINYAVSPIIEELPEGSLKLLEIEYVRKSDAESFVKENKIYVRIRPLENEDDNFFDVLFLYLELALIPEAKKLLAEDQKKAVLYFTSQKIVEGRKTLVDKLHDDYYAIDTGHFTQLRKYFEDIRIIENRGLFYGVMIRALERAASNIRFKQGNLTQEFDKISEYLRNFVAGIGKGGNADSAWHYSSQGNAFSLLLVANPKRANNTDPKLYVKRFNNDLKKTDWVFVIFSQAEYRYGAKVSRLIEDQGIVDLVFSTKSRHDYRKEKGGVVKLYVKKDKLKNY